MQIWQLQVILIHLKLSDNTFKCVITLINDLSIKSDG